MRTIDTDVLVLLISYVSQYIDEHSDMEIYASMINTNTFYNIKYIVLTVDSDVCSALPFFFAFTGCDTVSSFFGKGKCKAWDVWQENKNVDAITQTFIKLGHRPNKISENDADVLEEYVHDLYSNPSKKNTSKSLNDLRLHMFRTSSDNDFRKLPPCRNALIEHAKRASYQAGFLWQESVEDFDLPSPTIWGWTLDGNNAYIPLWSSETPTVDINTFIHGLLYLQDGRLI